MIAQKQQNVNKYQQNAFGQGVIMGAEKNKFPAIPLITCDPDFNICCISSCMQLPE